MRYQDDFTKRRLLSRSSVDETTPLCNGTHCRRWLRARTTFGHGQLWDGERLQYAHRLSFELFNGPIPDGAFVCHDCGNEWCIEPSHLYAGDSVTNGNDMVRHGRSTQGKPAPTRGMAHPHCKLSEEEARYILLMKGKRTATELRKELGVSDSLVYGIWKGRNWGWLQ